MNCSDYTGLCVYCDRRLGLTSDGTMVTHGPTRARCPGSWQPPLTGSIESRESAPEPDSVLSPAPPGTSDGRWVEVVRACRQMDDRANVRAATGPARFLS